jgi:hypothetical protein
LSVFTLGSAFVASYWKPAMYRSTGGILTPPTAVSWFSFAHRPAP